MVTSRSCLLDYAEFWLWKTFSKVVFLNINLPECRCRCSKIEELDEIADDSTDIFQRNKWDRYTNRQNSQFQNGKYTILENLCFPVRIQIPGEFLSYYHVDSKINDTSNYNDTHPVILKDEVVHGNHKSYIYPKFVQNFYVTRHNNYSVVACINNWWCRWR